MAPKNVKKQKDEKVTQNGSSWFKNLIRFLLKRIIEGLLFFLVVLCVFIYTTENKALVNFTSFSLSKTMPLEGKLAKNTRLNNAERLYVDLIKGPEAFDIYENELYFSAHGGLVYKFNEQGIKPVLKVGEKCSGIWQERTCGRPLGIKFDSTGKLYIADAYYGIQSANLTTGEIINIVPTNKVIDGKYPKLFNNIALSKGGAIYYTDSSTTDYLENGLLTLLADGTGRVLKWDPKKKTSTTLMDGLLFPNGIVLSPKEDYLLIAISGKSEILKYHLTGEKAGQSSVFATGLPGFPDNMRLDGKNLLIVSLMNPFDSDSENLFGKLSSWPNARKLFYYTLRLIDSIFEQLNVYYPSDALEMIAHWVGHFESMIFLGTKNSRVVYFDLNGTITDSLHGDDGSVSFISDFIEYKNAYFLGSPYNDYLARVKK